MSCWIVLAATLALASDHTGDSSKPKPAPAWTIETLATPPGIAPEVSAITFDSRGRLVACFRLGSVWTLDLESRRWRRFAEGLFWPLGVVAGEPGELFVAQTPELTRIVDSDGDGVADLYEAVCDDWGLGGNYHEFISGPVRAPDGGFWIGLGCASSGGPLRPPLRGEKTTRVRKGKIYGHHSPVPYRGWIVKISTDGTLKPFAPGFRQPNGLVVSEEGELFATDNQGDWVGTSPIHHVREGAFHGHPASLVWDPDFVGHPQDASIETLDAMRRRPAILIPQNDMAGSLAQPLFDHTRGRFGPFAEQLFVVDWTHARIHRVALEKIEGEYQGACFPFFEERGLRRGGNRLAFAPDGSLFVAQVSKIWGGTGEGLQRIRWTGRVPFEIDSMRLERNGFTLRFTKAVDVSSAGEASVYSIKHYFYLYHATYGSPKQDERPARVREVRVSRDGLEVRLVLDGLEKERVYHLTPGAIRSREGEPLETRMAAYTLNRLLPE